VGSARDKGEEQIAIGGGDVVAAFRDVHPRIASCHRTFFVIGSGRHLKPWGRFGGLAHVLESNVMESDGARGFGKDAPMTSGGGCALHAIGGDDDPCAFCSGVIGGGRVLHTDIGNSALVVGGGLIMSSGGTLAGEGIYEMGSNAAAREGMDDNNVLFKAASEADDLLHTNDDSSKYSAGNNDILVLGEGDDALPTNVDSGALCVGGLKMHIFTTNISIFYSRYRR
jgi:hypothetical protein